MIEILFRFIQTAEGVGLLQVHFILPTTSYHTKNEEYHIVVFGHFLYSLRIT